MYKSFCEDLEINHKYFKWVLAYEDTEIIWCWILEDITHKNIDYFWFPNVHIKRYTVLNEYRWKWIWTKILKELKDLAFNHFNLNVIFWETNEISWIKFYWRNWALFQLEKIKKYSNRNSPEDNIKYFWEFINNKVFSSYRYQTWDGLQFVFVKDTKTNETFIQNGFSTITNILKNIA